MEKSRVESSRKRDANAFGWMVMIMMVMLLRKGRTGTIDGEQAKGPNGRVFQAGLGFNQTGTDSRGEARGAVDSRRETKVARVGMRRE